MQESESPLTPNHDLPLVGFHTNCIQPMRLPVEAIRKVRCRLAESFRHLTSVPQLPQTRCRAVHLLAS